MKATLTIEVHDDFKKGEHKNCLLAPTKIAYCLVLNDICNADSCPLEIQEKPIIEDSKLYRILDVYRNCNGCKCKWGYDECGYVLCKSPNCIQQGE